MREELRVVTSRECARIIVGFTLIALFGLGVVGDFVAGAGFGVVLVTASDVLVRRLS